MAIEEVQRGFAADNNGIVLWVPDIADPTRPTATEIAAGTRLTYGLTADGFQHTVEVATVTSGRYTLAQALTYDGVVTDSVEVTYVYNRETPTPVETLIGRQGEEGFIVHALGYPNDHELTTGDIVNAVIPVTTSIPRDNPPTANTEATKTVRLNVVGVVGREVAIVAGSAG